MNSLTMRMRTCSVLGLVWLAFSAPYALAERGDTRQQRRDDIRQREAPERPDYRREPNQGFQRDGGERQRPQRLSPEERRQLRSDIRDAGQEIYPRRR